MTHKERLTIIHIWLFIIIVILFPGWVILYGFGIFGIASLMLLSNSVDKASTEYAISKDPEKLSFYKFLANKYDVGIGVFSILLGMCIGACQGFIYINFVHVLLSEIKPIQPIIDFLNQFHAFNLYNIPL